MTDKPPLANFDSASTMTRALGRCLHGRDFPMLGVIPKWGSPGMRAVGAAVNALPVALRRQVYIWSGWSEAVSIRRLAGVRTAEIADWAVQQYPRKRYPAAMIGSSNGALMHLCAALGIPWLPQTVLIPVRRHGVDAGDPAGELEWGREPAAGLLEANPDLALHHMHDPNQDQLMIRRMSYFRVKMLRLPQAYKDFLLETLEPGGTIFVADCRLRWPAVKVGERHVFQFGALGGLSPEEYTQGGPRVARFLEQHGSSERGWKAPAPDHPAPEAEWGFEPALRDELEVFADENGFRLQTIAFEHPEDPSPLVADLYRAWYHQNGMPADTLLMPNFILMEPYWTLRTGAVPFWTVFNVEPSADALERYLSSRDPFDDIYLMLFSHGAESAGLASAKRWRSLAENAKRRGKLLGADERNYPRDFATFTRYYRAFQKEIQTHHPTQPPPRFPLRDLDSLRAQLDEDFRVNWT